MLRLWQIHRAAWGREARHADVIRVLVEEGGVDVALRAINGQTAWDMAIAAQPRNKAVVKMLKRLSKKKNKKSPEGNVDL